jgi:hypothetical protein|tara:strand:+ start:310 stop:570 length:261 start_codon:yes stop_codon:yes gene_type:complete
MSNEFDCSVHNFYNHSVQELREMKKDFLKNTVAEFISRCDNAIGYKESTADIYNCVSLKEWSKKWEGATDDDEAYQIAEEYFEEAV